MFNISEKTVITGLEKTGCKVSHIEACIHDKNLHEAPKFTYFGPCVSKGTQILHTKNGDFTIRFDEKGGWARSIDIL